MQGYSKIMIWSLVVPVVVGLSTVFQAGLNRSISKDWGLGSALLMNSLVVAALSALAWLLSRNADSRLSVIMGETWSDLMKDQAGAFQQFSWWYAIPGLFGFLIITGIPIAIQKVGALQTFIVLIGSQIIGSLLWDLLIEKRPVNTIRLVGAGLSFLSALIVNLKG